MPKLRTSAYLMAGERHARNESVFGFTCWSINLAVDEPCFRKTPERTFHEQVHGFTADDDAKSLLNALSPNGHADEEQLKQVRLMALALTHTLAVEHNAGRFSL